MNEILKLLKKLVKNSGFDLLVLTITGLIGIFGESILEQALPGLFDPRNTPILIFILTSAMYIATVAIWRSTGQKIAILTQNTGILAKTMGQRITVAPYSEVYDEFIERVLNAKSEIRILSDYVFDWEKGKPDATDYDPSWIQSKERKATFQAFQDKIKTSRGSGFKFVRIFQIPSGHRLEEALPYDPVYYEDSKFLAEIGKVEPEFACLRVSDIIFQNTFCVIDESFLYLEFDTRKPPDMGPTFHPLVMLIESG